MRFVITSSPSGVRLSLRGHWGNQPHADAGAAELAAREYAAGRSFTIEREKGRK